MGVATRVLVLLLGSTTAPTAFRCLLKRNLVRYATKNFSQRWQDEANPLISGQGFVNSPQLLLLLLGGMCARGLGSSPGLTAEIGVRLVSSQILTMSTF